VATVEQWRSLKQFAAEEANYSPGDLVRRKDQTKSEKTVHLKVGIILAIDATQQAWIKMAKVMWSGTSDIEEVATIYLEKVPQDNDDY
tara:strand:+ start:3876 stop:4139 length:264 start_codon:yes stop_codon:yes gene_type:complete